MSLCGCVRISRISLPNIALKSLPTQKNCFLLILKCISTVVLSITLTRMAPRVPREWERSVIAKATWTIVFETRAYISYNLRFVH